MRKRSVSIRGHRTSISVEDAFWAQIQRMASDRDLSAAALVAEIDAARVPQVNLSSALRLAVLEDALGKKPVRTREG